MNQNNLDPMVANILKELITYGGNGGFFSKLGHKGTVYKTARSGCMTDEQTLHSILATLGTRWALNFLRLKKPPESGRNQRYEFDSELL